MKKIFFILVCLLVSHSSWAGDNTVNVRFSPLGIISGVINGGVDFRVSEKWTLGGELQYLSTSSSLVKVTAQAVGVRAQYFFSGAFSDSWYFAPFGLFMQADGEDKINPGITAEATGTVFGALMGYMWAWSSFNIQLGGGVQVLNLEASGQSNNVTVINFSDFNVTYPALEFSLGWAF